MKSHWKSCLASFFRGVPRDIWFLVVPLVIILVVALAGYLITWLLATVRE